MTHEEAIARIVELEASVDYQAFRDHRARIAELEALVSSANLAVAEFETIADDKGLVIADLVADLDRATAAAFEQAAKVANLKTAITAMAKAYHNVADHQSADFTTCGYKVCQIAIEALK